MLHREPLARTSSWSSPRLHCPAAKMAEKLAFFLENLTGNLDGCSLGVRYGLLTGWPLECWNNKKANSHLHLKIEKKGRIKNPTTTNLRPDDRSNSSMSNCIGISCKIKEKIIKMIKT